MTVPNRFVGGAFDLGALKHASEKQAASGGKVQTFFEVTLENFESEVLRRSVQVPVIVLIGSERAEVSAQLRTDLKDLAEGQRSFLVGYVDADSTPQIAQAFGVRALPSVIALAAGRPLANFEGGQPKDQLVQWLAAIQEAVAGKLEGLGDGPAEADEDNQDPRLDEALEALNRGDYDAAIAIYDQILGEEKDPQVSQARAAAVVLKRSETSQREEFAQADREIIAGDPEKAFDGLIELMKASSGDEKTEVKDRLIELFGLFDNSDARVKKARTKLASALY